MLTAVYTSAIYGGSITAVLIHTPGTPASAATAMDGYEMTKRGEGVKAIGIVTIASMIGGTISAIALMFISPPLAQLSLKFSAPRIFSYGPVRPDHHRQPGGRLAGQRSDLGHVRPDGGHCGPGPP